MKKKQKFICIECDYEVAKWEGKCPSCQQWNTFEEGISNRKNSSNKNIEVVKLNEVENVEASKFMTGLSEFDRVMGDGVTLGSLILVGGQPGIGKSTLLLEISSKLAKKKKKILYISAEESKSQVAARGSRLNINQEEIFLANECVWQNIKDIADKLKPDLLIIDSIQTIMSNEVSTISGSPSQIKECTHEILNYCKSKSITTFIIGHVTKEGNIAGPKMLEHMVDTVIYFEGDQFGHYRLLRTIKNRFGRTNEVGVFEMSEKGLKQVQNPSSFFLDGNSDNSYGRSLTCIMEGSRPLFVEIQALVSQGATTSAKKISQGIDQNRLNLLAAVIEKYLELPLSFNDVFINVVGGIRLSKRDSDLSIIASIISSFYSKPLPKKTIFLGEVGLTGEIRVVPYIEERLREIDHMNYEKIFLSEKSIKKLSRTNFNFELIGLNQISDVKNILS